MGRVEDTVQGFMESAYGGMILLDRSGKIVLANAELERLFGYPRQDLAGKPTSMLVSKSLRSKYRARISRFLSHRDTHPKVTWRDMMGLRSNGSEFPLKLSLSSFESKGEGYALASVVDISDQVHIESALRSSEAPDQDARKAAFVGSWEWNPSNGATWWSEELYRLFGYAPGEVEPSYHRFLDMVPPEEREAVKTHLRDVLARSAPAALQFRMKLDDGTHRHMYALVKADTNAEGEPVRLSGIVQDITGRLLEEETLRKSSDAIRDLYGITADHKSSLDDRIRRVLKIGCSTLGMELGIFSHIVGDKYEIVQSVADSMPEIPAGTVFSLGQTYCRETVAARESIGFECASGSHWATHPCYQTFNLEAYLGTPVYVGREVYGTLNFSSRKPRSRPYLSTELVLLQLMSRWMGSELERADAEASIREAAAALEKERQALVSKNVALKEVLDHIQQEKANFKHELAAHIEDLFKPYLAELKATGGKLGPKKLAVLESDLNALIGKDIESFRKNYAKLSPREIEVCELIKEGLTTKEICEQMNVSPNTVNTHRETIRRKLRIKNAGVNLGTYLKSR